MTHSSVLTIDNCYEDNWKEPSQEPKEVASEFLGNHYPFPENQPNFIPYQPVPHPHFSAL